MQSMANAQQPEAGMGKTKLEKLEEKIEKLDEQIEKLEAEIQEGKKNTPDDPRLAELRMDRNLLREDVIELRKEANQLRAAAQGIVPGDNSDNSVGNSASVSQLVQNAVIALMAGPGGMKQGVVSGTRAFWL